MTARAAMDSVACNVNCLHVMALHPRVPRFAPQEGIVLLQIDAPAPLQVTMDNSVTSQCALV